MIKLNVSEIQLVACHRKPERSFFYKGKQFPVCARCTGIIIGYLTVPLFLLNIIGLDIWTSILANIPALIDGYTQALGWRESTNGLRLFTGILCGIGQVGLISIFGDMLGKLVRMIL